MANNLPWFKFHISDWLDDFELSMCRPATRGIWIDAICVMHSVRRATLEGSCDQLSRSLRCTASDLRTALNDLASTGTATVVERNGVITLTCRRVEKELKIMQANCERQQRFRKKHETTLKIDVTARNKNLTEKNKNVTLDNSGDNINESNILQEHLLQCNADVTAMSRSRNAIDPDPDKRSYISNLVAVKGGVGGNPPGASAPDTDKKSFSEKRVRKKPLTAIPKDFTVGPETIAWVKQKVPDCDIAAETAAFQNHHTAHGTLMADWYAAFRSWIDRKLEFRGRKSSAPPAARQLPVQVCPQTELAPLNEKTAEPAITPPPEVCAKVWRRAREKILSDLGGSCFDTWFAPVVFRGINAGVLGLSVPNESFRYALTENFKPLLLESTGANELKIELWE